jgi:hypothetical protein
MWLMWNLVFVHYMMVLVSEQDRCTVCAKCTIGLENRFGHIRWYSKLTGLFGDSANLDALR